MLACYDSDECALKDCTTCPNYMYEEETSEIPKRVNSDELSIDQLPDDITDGDFS